MQKMNERNSHFKLYHLVAAALLTAISVALTPLNVYIPLFGVSSLRFSVTDIPVFLCGALFGPVLGMISGFLSDILGFVLAPAGPYFFGFTLNKMVAGFIPGLVFYTMKNKEKLNDHKIQKINVALSLFALIGALVYIHTAALEEVEKMGHVAGLPMKTVLSVMMVGIVVALMAIVLKLSKVFAAREGVYKLQTVVMAVSLSYILISLILSPIWVHTLYNVPIYASVIARMFKGLINVPLQVIICYTVLQSIPIKVRQKILC